MYRKTKHIHFVGIGGIGMADRIRQGRELALRAAIPDNGKNDRT